MCTRLEQLPNECLLDLFEYVDTRDLYYGFRGLNERFDRLVRSLTRLSLTLDRDEPDLILSFGNQIVRVVVNTWQEIDLDRFPHLRSLILHQATSTQWRQIRSSALSQLVYLSTASIAEFSSVPEFVQSLFSNELPWLRHVDLAYTPSSFARAWSQSPGLSSVSIECNDPTMVSYVLRSCPNLISLHVHFALHSIPIFQHTLPITPHPLTHFVLSDPYHHLLFTHVYTLLACIPNVKRMRLNFLCRVPFLRFARGLLYRLPGLTRFDCCIDDASADQNTDVGTIRELHPCFARLHVVTSERNFRTFTTD